MQPEDQGAAFAESTRSVEDANSFRFWVAGPLQVLMPHRGLLCGQSIAHSGGFAAIQKWSFDVPSGYERAVVCEGGNIRSPLFTRMMKRGQAQFFDISRHAGSVDAAWERVFREAGWQNVLCLGRLRGPEAHATLTWAVFYDLARSVDAVDFVRHELLMQQLDEALTRLHGARRSGGKTVAGDEIDFRMTSAQHELVSLLANGLTNKEIGRVLGKSGETIKRQISTLMRKTKVRNRTELACLALTLLTTNMDFTKSIPPNG
ncbi:conserved hypothetical protein [Burkholderiales bacterium 8X]|nr:conserved hypothetical protein [Burkholderiales bacterium 8X]